MDSMEFITLWTPGVKKTECLAISNIREYECKRFFKYYSHMRMQIVKETYEYSDHHYSLSILKRQLERGCDVMLRCQMSHVYMIIFLIILIFLLEIFLNARNKEYIYKNILVVLLNKNYLILFKGKNEIWHIKNAQVPDLLLCTFNLCHITKILKNICLIMNFICCSMNQHSNACLIRHHYPIFHERYLTHTESLKIHIRCSTLLTVATIVWQRSN